MKRILSLCLITLLCASFTAMAARRTPGQTSPLVTENQDHWLGILKSDAAREEKAHACRELAVIGTKAAVPTLVGLLSNPELNHMALYALQTMPAKEVDTALTGQLSQLKGRQLCGVVTTLGIRKYSKAFKPIAALLDNSDPLVVQAAARALGLLGTADAAKALKAALVSPSVTANPLNLAAVYEGSLRCAENLNGSGGMTKNARLIYDTLSKQADPPDHIRAAVTAANIRYARKGDLSPLKTALADDHPAVFGAAVQGAMRMPGAEVSRVLEQSVRTLPVDRQIVVVQALGLRHAPESVPTLAVIARDFDQKPLRLAALRALASIGDKPALETLQHFLNNGDESLAHAALDGLAGVTGPDADALALKLLNSKEKAQTLTGIELVGRRRMHTAVPALLALLKDSDPAVRSAAIKRFSDLGAEKDVQPLLSFLLGTSDRRQLEMAADALSSIAIRAGKPAPVVSQVVAGLDRSQPVQAEALLKALCSIGNPAALQAVRKSSTSAEPELRRASIRALADWPDASAAPDLLAIMNANPAPTPAEHTLAFRGYIRLAQNSGKSPEEKLKMLSACGSIAASREEKLMLLGAIGEIPSPAALQLARPYLAEPESADDAANAILRIASQLDAKNKADLEPALKEILKSAKSEATLEKARKRMTELGIAAE